MCFLWDKLRTGLVLAAALLLPCSAFAQSAADAFSSLRRLVGDWEAKTARGSTLRVSWKLVAADSVLVETFAAGSGRETLTVYHADGPNLIATHYCAQGNQPRLRLEPSSTTTVLRFAFQDATNLSDPRASHLTRLLFRLTDAGHFEKTEVYNEAGKEDVTVFSFARVPLSR